MKKNLIILLFALSILFIAAPAYAVDVYIDGEKLQTDAEPLIKNNRTMVPMRAIFEAIGATVTYSAPKSEGEDATIWATKAHRKIGMNVSPITSLNPSNRTFIVDEIDGKMTAHNNFLDSPPFIMNGRTFIPLRFVAEAFGGDVRYENNTVYITRGAMPEVGPMLTDEEKTLFRNIVRDDSYAKMPYNIFSDTLTALINYQELPDFLRVTELQNMIVKLQQSFDQVIYRKKQTIDLVSNSYAIQDETFRKEVIQILTDDLRLYEDLNNLTTQVIRYGYIEDADKRVEQAQEIYARHVKAHDRVYEIQGEYGF